MFEKYKIIKQIGSHIDEYSSKKMYLLFGSMYTKELFSKRLTIDKLKYFYNLIKVWDNQIAVPKEVGNYL